ncbi:ATP-binding protein [Enterococcus faecalis]|uniref:AAA family ATPase n=1 Tax=Enterococcus faecalis TaxID=1351 RepID=UPI0001F0DA5D|nr:ATP-binding protein [Enterococcus faecalis]EFT95161.1 ATPase, AAA family [Enterococcus faecalis TX0012]EHU8539418.1 ATP-binding protein [Enterococcus faecalis]
MATADQVKALVKAHLDGNEDKFKTTVLQIAAYEAKKNHVNFARELKKLVETRRTVRQNVISMNKVNPMLQMTLPDNHINDLIVSDEIKDRISRILNEYRNKNKLQQFGLDNRRKILIEGPPGTGKTYTASVVASELSLPLYTVQVDKLVTKFMGETSVKLRQIFESIENNVGVYFFDEFDAIGTDRSMDNEVGEMRRILNSFLQFFEQDTSDSIIIAATNNQKLLDQALFRRFDDVLHYDLPSEIEVKKIFSHRLEIFQKGIKLDESLIKKAKALSQADLVKICDDAIKQSILSDTKITEKQLLNLVEERTNIYTNKEA